MASSLVDLPGIAQPEAAQREYVIPIHRCCAVKVRRSRGTLAVLERTLRELRRAGYEAEIHLRGTFRPGRSSRPRVLDLQLEGWQLTPTGIDFDPPLGTHWEPLPAFQPRPTFVVKGYRSRYSPA